MQSAEKSGAINSSCPRGSRGPRSRPNHCHPRRFSRWHGGPQGPQAANSPIKSSKSTSPSPSTSPGIAGGASSHVSVVRAKPSTADSTMEPSPISVNADESDAERCRVGHEIGDQELLAEPATVGFRRVPLHRFQSDPAGSTIGRTLHTEGVFVWGSTIWRRVVVPPPVGHHRRGIAGVQSGRGQNGVAPVDIAVAIPPVVGVVRQVTGRCAIGRVGGIATITIGDRDTTGPTAVGGSAADGPTLVGLKIVFERHIRAVRDDAAERTQRERKSLVVGNFNRPHHIGIAGQRTRRGNPAVGGGLIHQRGLVGRPIGRPQQFRAVGIQSARLRHADLHRGFEPGRREEFPWVGIQAQPDGLRTVQTKKPASKSDPMTVPLGKYGKMLQRPLNDAASVDGMVS